MLDARLGDFITEENQESGGPKRTPIIKHYDLMQLTITELKTPTDTADNTYQRLLFVDDIEPIVNSQGQFLILELFGRERYLQKMLFPGHFYFISFKEMAERIIKFYNDNKGSNQPTITLTMPVNFDYTWGIFDFSKETSCYDALMEVVNRLTLPVAAGGGGEYYGMTFSETNTSTALVCRIAPQGHPTGSPITLQKPMQLSEVKEPNKASIVVVEGKPGSASIPPEPAKYRSYIEEYANIPAWKSGITYKQGALVRRAHTDNEVYVWRSLLDNNINHPPILGTSPPYWFRISLEQYIALYETNFVYSPWTKDKHALYRNYCGNPDAVFYNTSPSTRQNDTAVMPDSNMVIRESIPGTTGQLGLWRDSVDFRLSQLTNTILDRYLYGRPTIKVNNRKNRQYEGMRILCDDEPPSGLDSIIARQFHNGTTWERDEFGVSFGNNFATLGESGNWIVFRRTQRFDECIVLHEGKTFQYNKDYKDSTNEDLETQSGNHFQVPDMSAGGTLAWRDDVDLFLGNDAFHHPVKIEQQDGLYKLHENISTGSLPTDSGIEIEYAVNPKRLDETQTSAEDKAGIVEQLEQFWGWLTTDQATTDGKFDLGKTLVNKLSQAIGWAGDTVYDALFNWSRGAHMNNAGWWAILFAPPFPRNTYNSITEGVGALFGGNADNPVPVLDLRNLNYTPKGNTGYAAEDAMNLGQISGIKLLMNFNIYGLNIETFRGNIPFRCWIETTRGDLLVCDKSIRFQGITQLLDFPITQFKQYRARIPISLTGANIVSRVLNPELSITEIFERRKVKRIGLQCMLAYDDQGRYDPVNFWGFIRTFLAAFPDNELKFNGRIDYLHFTKDAIVVAQNKTDDTYTESAQATDIKKYHLADSHKRYPNISNINQLQKIANTELDIENFSHDKWTATYMDEARIKAERTVKLKDESLIPDSEDTNKRELIVKKVTYSVGDRATNSGMKTTIDLYKKVIPRK